MGKIVLNDGTLIELTDEQSISLAKAIMILPHHKLLIMDGVTFSVNDIDQEASKKARLPQQTRLGIEVASVEPKVQRRME